MTESERKIQGSEFTAADVGSGSGSTDHRAREKSFAGRHEDGETRMAGQEGTAVIRHAAPPKSGIGASGHSAANPHRLHPVFCGRLLPLGVRRGESGDYRFVRTEAWGSRFRYRIA